MNSIIRVLLCAMALIPMQSMPMNLSAQARFALAKSEKCARCGINNPQQFSGCNFKKIIGVNNFHGTFFKKNASMVNGLKKEIQVSRFEDAVRALQKNQFCVDVHNPLPDLFFGSFRDCQGNICNIMSTYHYRIKK